MHIQFTTRQGRTIRMRYSRKAAVARLAKLDASEAHTLAIMPTDSGDVRFNNNAEAEAIRAQLPAIGARGALRL